MRDDEFLREDPPAEAKYRAHARESGTDHHDWRLEPHVCGVCFGRIASRPADDGSPRRQYQCTNCGVHAVSTRASCICACGLKMAKGGKRGTTMAMVDMGIRCHANAAPSPEFPALYVASYAGAQAVPGSDES